MKAASDCSHLVEGNHRESPAPPDALFPGLAPIDVLSFMSGRETEGAFWSEPGVILNCRI